MMNSASNPQDLAYSRTCSLSGVSQRQTNQACSNGVVVGCCLLQSSVLTGQRIVWLEPWLSVACWQTWLRYMAYCWTEWTGPTSDLYITTVSSLLSHTARQRDSLE